MVGAVNTTNGVECDVKLETDVTWDATTISGSTAFVRKIYSSEAGTRRGRTPDQQYQTKGGSGHVVDLTVHSDSASSDTRRFQS